MGAQPTLVLATANPHKIREMAALLSGCGWRVEPAPGDSANVEETELDFAGNARCKALAVAGATGCIALADDSGLEVDALDGEPGVRSRRWAGDDASDADRIAKLLEALDEMPPERRTARFVCAACIAAPAGVLWEGIGKVDGSIALTPRGEGGFGYDPVFLVEDTGRAMAQLDEAGKNAVSHRGRAMAQALSWLRRNTDTAIQCRSSGGE